MIYKRDADKLDIFSIIVDYYEKNAQQHNQALGFGLPGTPGFPKEFIHDIERLINLLPKDDDI